MCDGKLFTQYHKFLKIHSIFFIEIAIAIILEVAMCIYYISCYMHSIGNIHSYVEYAHTTIVRSYVITEYVTISGVASVDNWRGEYSYIRVHRP